MTSQQKQNKQSSNSFQISRNLQIQDDGFVDLKKRAKRVFKSREYFDNRLLKVPAFGLASHRITSRRALYRGALHPRGDHPKHRHLQRRPRDPAPLSRLVDRCLLRSSVCQKLLSRGIAYISYFFELNF